MYTKMRGETSSTLMFVFCFIPDAFSQGHVAHITFYEASCYLHPRTSYIMHYYQIIKLSLYSKQMPFLSCMPKLSSQLPLLPLFPNSSLSTGKLECSLTVWVRFALNTTSFPMVDKTQTWFSPGFLDLTSCYFPSCAQYTPGSLALFQFLQEACYLVGGSLSSHHSRTAA